MGEGGITVMIEQKKNGNNFVFAPDHTHIAFRANGTVLGLGKLLCLEDSFILFSLQVVANLSGCAAVDSETLMQCLRGKSEAEILDINKVGRMVWLGNGR